MLFSKTFTKFNAVDTLFNVVGNIISTPSNSVTLVSVTNDTGIGSWSVYFNIISTNVLVNQSAQTVVQPDGNSSVRKEFTVDYNIIPSIAKIKKVVYRLPRKFTMVAGKLAPASGAATFRTVPYYIGGLILFSNFSDLSYPAMTVTFTESFNGSLADIILYDGGLNGEISKTTLIADFSALSNSLILQSIINTALANLTEVQNASIFLNLEVGKFSLGANWEVTVYYTLTFQWYLHIPSTPVTDGTEITITSEEATGLTPLDFTLITSVNMVPLDINGSIYGTPLNIPSEQWTFIETREFKFTLTPFAGTWTPRPRTIAIQLTSTQFDGTLTTAPLTTIYYLNAPGVYKLVKGKTSDSLYNVNSLPNTVDIQIPDPFIRTGFIGD